MWIYQFKGTQWFNTHLFHQLTYLNKEFRIISLFWIYTTKITRERSKQQAKWKEILPTDTVFLESPTNIEIITYILWLIYSRSISTCSKEKCIQSAWQADVLKLIFISKRYVQKFQNHTNNEPIQWMKQGAVHLVIKKLLLTKMFTIRTVVRK